MTAGPIKHKKLIIALSIILIFILTFAATIFIIIKIGENRLKNDLLADEKIELSDDYDYSADVYHNGKAYYYNDEIVNVLILGIDKYTDRKKSQGQADAIYLASINTEAKQVNIFAISRNTLADVDVFGADGNYYATENQQICLSYAYGKSDEQSSLNCAKSVSRLFFGIPINAYYTVYLDAVSDIVKAIGSVEVTLNEELPAVFPNNRKGDKVVINGDNALEYLRARGESNAPRLERQKEFLSKFISLAKSKTAKDLSLPVNIYKKIAKRAATNIDVSSVAYMASQLVNAKISTINIEGVSGFDGKYETFEADEEKLYSLVLERFYVAKK